MLAGANLGWVAAAAAASVWTFYVRAQRWRTLLRRVRPLPLYPVLSATCIGFGASAVLPLRLGEFVRPALLGRQTGIGLSAALSSVVVERLFDMLLVVACFLLLAMVFPLPGHLRQSGVWLAAIAAVALLALLLAHRYRTRAAIAAAWLVDRLPATVARAARPLVSGFLEGLSGLTDGRTVAVVLGYSTYLWALIALTYLFCLLALRIEIPLAIGSLTAMVVVAAFVFLPQGPGFVGTWQAGCVLALSLFGVPQDQAVGYSLLTWIVMMAVNIGVGGWFLARENVSLGQLVRTTEHASTAEVEG